MRASDRAEFEAFARARSHELLRAGWLLTGDRQRGEDLAQEALARIYTRWRRVRAADNPAAYARTVLTRLHLDSVRRRSSTELPLADPPEQRGTDPDSDLRHDLVAALRTLSPLDRVVVVQRYLLDLEVAAVAHDLGLSENAVRSRASRALARVRDHLGSDFLELHRARVGPDPQGAGADRRAAGRAGHRPRVVHALSDDRGTRPQRPRLRGWLRACRSLPCL